MTVHIAGPLATAQLLAIAATQAACPSDGDRSEPVSAPDDGAWMSGRDSDWRAGAAEDRAERQWRWFER